MNISWEEAIKLFTTNMHSRLKEKINAGVYVIIKDDSLVVTISKYDIRYHYTRPNILIDIIHGNADKIINEIVKNYRGFILHTYFH